MPKVIVIGRERLNFDRSFIRAANPKKAMIHAAGHTVILENMAKVHPSIKITAESFALFPVDRLCSPAYARRIIDEAKRSMNPIVIW